ncbi:MAG: GtrA family protein [Glaciimonas sp.]|nr:GtrA family protein [Glaciimonas sp.]
MKLGLVRSAIASKLSLFIFVGGVGFAVDAGLLTLLARGFEVNVYAARLVSFTVAVAVTWLLNRTLVFHREVDHAVRKRVEYGRYLLVQICGGLANLAVFVSITQHYPQLQPYPVVPLFFGSLLGLVINFGGSRYWVFKQRRVAR